jgi:hypothetical protein
MLGFDCDVHHKGAMQAQLRSATTKVARSLKTFDPTCPSKLFESITNALLATKPFPQ